MDRITDKIYRKNIFYQKFSKYLPSKILLHGQVISSLKKLTMSVDEGTTKDLFEFAQILKFLQLENVLLWEHLITILIDHDFIKSKDEILRQLPNRQSDSSFSLSDSQQKASGTSSKQDFDCFMGPDMMHGKGNSRLLVPKQAKGKLKRQNSYKS